MTFTGDSLPGRLQGGMSGKKRGKPFDFWKFLNEGRKLGKKQQLKVKKKRKN